MNEHSTSIKRIGIAVLLISLVAAFSFGLLFGTHVTIPAQYSFQSDTYTFVYNWSICGSVALGGVLFSFIFFALSHLTAAVEETRQSIAISADRILDNKKEEKLKGSVNL